MYCVFTALRCNYIINNFNFNLSQTSAGTSVSCKRYGKEFPKCYDQIGVSHGKTCQHVLGLRQ